MHVRGVFLLFLSVVVCLPAAAAGGGLHSPGVMAAEVPVVVYPGDYSQRWLDDRTFVYGPPLLDFDLDAYLARHAPHLRPHAEFISHWCGYYSISPKVLLSVLELRSAAVTRNDGQALADPSAGLVAGAGFDEQVHAILGALHRDFYAFRASQPRELNAATYALLNLFRSQSPAAAFAAAVEPARLEFVATFDRLFPGSRTEGADLAVAAVPPPDLLQLPWKQGEEWYFNGVHTTTGSDPGVMSSIDLTRTWSQVWGDDTSTDYVVAALAGQVSVFSPCNVRVTSPSGWATNYYHLSNLVVSNGQQVSADQTLGVYAGTEAQALCQGGSSTGPHVHFSLLKDGAYSALDGTLLSRYAVHSGRFSYDYDGAYMWLEKEGVKSFAYVDPVPSGLTETLPSLTISDAAAFEKNSGTSSVRFTVTLSHPAPATVMVGYATADGTAASGTLSTITTSDGDYAATSGTLVIPTGATSQTLDVTANGDTAVESSETFFVNLSSPSGATIADAQGRGLILNDDFSNPALGGGFARTAAQMERDSRGRRGRDPHARGENAP